MNNKPPPRSAETPPIATLTIAQAIEEAAIPLRKAGVAAARREAGSLLAHTIGRNRTFLLTHGDEPLTAADLTGFRAHVARRSSREPLQYITGQQEFWGLEFVVTPDVLIPRPETELLVEAALGLIKKVHAPLICDVGTGSGCVAVALLYERHEARAVGIDISPAALGVAQRNAACHNVSERLALIAADCFTALNVRNTRFTLILANPPYIAEGDIASLQPEVRDYEPRAALTPGGEGLAMIYQLLAEAPRFLVPGGHLLFEIGFDQHQTVRASIDRQTWTLVDIHKDLQGLPRTVVLKLSPISTGQL